MIVILEGAPGSGKTTYAKHLRTTAQKLNGGFVFSYRYPRPKCYADFRKALRQIETLISRTSINDLLILDRHPLISQPIFAPYTFRCKCEGALIASQIVYCNPGLETIRANRPNSIFFPHFAEILNAYDETMNEYKKGFDVKDFDYTRPWIE